MLRKIVIVTIGLLAIVFLSGSAYAERKKYCKIPPVESSSEAIVTRVIDGDTIVVKMIKSDLFYIVRLIGVDTPETVHPTKQVEYFGKEAIAYTKRNLLGKYVKLTYDWQKQDKYRRLLAYIWIDGKIFNRKIIEDGYAFAYIKYSFRDEYMRQFRKAEEDARTHKRGLWKGVKDGY